MIYENSDDLKRSMQNKVQHESEEECDTDDNVWDDDFTDSEEEEELNGNISHSLIINKPLPPVPVAECYDVPQHFEGDHTSVSSNIKGRPNKPKMLPPEVKPKNLTVLPVSFAEESSNGGGRGGAPIPGNLFMQQLSFKLKSQTSIEKSPFKNRPLPICPTEEENYEICEHVEQISNNHDENYEICDQNNSSPAPKENNLPKQTSNKINLPVSKVQTVTKEESYNYIPPNIMQTFSQVQSPKVNLPPPDVYEFPDVAPPIIKRDSKQINSGSNQSFNREPVKSHKEESVNTDPLQKIFSKIEPSESYNKNIEEKKSPLITAPVSNNTIQKRSSINEISSVKPQPILASKKPPEIQPKKPPEIQSTKPESPISNKESFKKQLSLLTAQKPPIKSRILPSLPNEQEHFNQKNNPHELDDENYEICDQTNSHTKPVLKEMSPVKPVDTKTNPSVVSAGTLSRNNTYIQPNVPLFFTQPQQKTKDSPLDETLNAPPIIKRDPKNQPNAGNNENVIRGVDKSFQEMKVRKEPSQIEISKVTSIVMPSPNRINAAPEFPLPEKNKAENQSINVQGKPQLPERSFPKPIVPIVPKINGINEKLWYHGDINRDDSIKLLKSWNKESAFLVRNTNKGEGYSISIFHKGNVTHLRINLKDNCFYLGTSEKPFKSVEDLIKFYQSNLLSLTSGAEVCLTTTPPRLKK
ncbi:uncharacterized protein LOC105844953 isoform X2 [Hydra vulgaris]|uniref:uncharacterized protein LOC105844953 isoform X2 n=1 Tax=Hydra vulgaris TaxID=6087 RepID=UPI001F5FF1F5|nr:uncharacterized protein LOC105844953 [Hydra vulgaris]